MTGGGSGSRSSDVSSTEAAISAAPRYNAETLTYCGFTIAISNGAKNAPGNGAKRRRPASAPRIITSNRPKTASAPLINPIGKKDRTIA